MIWLLDCLVRFLVLAGLSPEATGSGTRTLARRTRLQAYVLLLTVTVTADAGATRLTVRAQLEDGSNAGAGVIVTVASGSYLDQAVTGGNSRVTFQDVPVGSATVTGQRDSLRGQLTSNVNGKNQTVALVLRSALTPPSVRISINNGNSCTVYNSVALNNVVSGPSPKGYRASEDAATLRTLPWQLYAPAPPFELSNGAGTKTIYFQVQSFVSGNELVSSIASDTIQRVAPKANAILNLDNGASRTTSRTVTLDNTTSFDPPGTNPRYIASENPNFDGTSWQPYGNAPRFTLSESVGTKTVYFMATQEVCGALVGTQKVSDSIQLSVEAVALTPIEPNPVITRHVFNWTTSVKPADVISYAASQGFSFGNTRRSGSGSCARDGARLTASPVVRSNTPAPTYTQYSALACNWSMFGGRNLNSGWKSMQVEISSSPPYPYAQPRFSTLPVTGTDNPGFAVTIELPELTFGPVLPGPRPGFTAVGAASTLIQEIVVEGPSTNWRDAYRQ